eukprot:TRINITY_DN31420_c0_g1_i1.p1 TRINITY_DN31420_c0_g1~~TRINITY_DN31420_c0_g1_i1.p1  ORF type:complete len:293 (+),score=67.46 TRINITY_DN31420_c0_g1_i1:52-879(+)
MVPTMATKILMTIGAFAVVQAQDLPAGLECDTGPHAKVWGRVRDLFSAAVVEAGSPMVPSRQPVMSAALDTAMKELTQAKAFTAETEGNCGIGRLSLQLMTLAATQDGAALLQAFAQLEQISSPVLTLLLDVPWLAVAHSGWPIFGLLSQLNLRKREVASDIDLNELDGTNDPLVKMFKVSLSGLIQSADLRAMDNVASSFLEQQPKNCAMAIVTAVSVQAAAMPDANVRAQLVQALQASFKQMIGSALELDVAISTGWPVWGLVHIAVAALDFR